ncbi:MAG: hypothetical protein J5803_02405 [Desulfovibrio sp.]|nr:hypothetical protein [Desulfovibrio sp.]
MGIELGKTLVLRPKLSFRRVDADALIEEGKRSRGGKTKPLDWSGIEHVKIYGSVQIGELAFKKFPFRHLTLPVVLADKILQLSGIEGELYGGHLNGSVTVIFSKSIEIQSNGSLLACQLEEFSKDALKNGRLYGVSTLKGAFQSAFSSFSEWPACLWGKWDFTVKNGGYQAFDDKERVKGKPTNFSLLQGSGVIEKGVLRSNNVRLEGDGLRLKGAGELNLGKMAFDGKFDVEKKGVPSFPLYVEGTFDKTKTSIGVGALLLNAVGGIFRGILGIFN